MKIWLMALYLHTAWMPTDAIYFKDAVFMSETSCKDMVEQMYATHDNSTGEDKRDLRCDEAKVVGYPDPPKPDYFKFPTGKGGGEIK